MEQKGNLRSEADLFRSRMGGLSLLAKKRHENPPTNQQINQGNHAQPV